MKKHKKYLQIIAVAIICVSTIVATIFSGGNDMIKSYDQDIGMLTNKTAKKMTT